MRPRFRFPPALVDGGGARLAYRSRLSALGAGCKLRRRRAAVDVLSSGFLAAWRPAGNHQRVACGPGAVRAAGAAGRGSQHVPAGAGVGVTGGGYLCRLSLHRQPIRHVRGLRTLSAGRVAGRRMASSDGAVCLENPLLHCTARLVGGCPVAHQFARRGRGQLYAGSPRAGNVDRGRQTMARSSRRGWNGPGAGTGRVLHRARRIRTAMGTNRSRDHSRDAGRRQFPLRAHHERFS